MRPITFPRSWYNYVQKRWLLAFFASTLPSYVFVFVELSGDKFGLNKSGELTGLGWAIFLLFLVPSVIFVFLKSLTDSYDEHVKISGQKVLDELLQSSYAMTAAKVHRVTEYAKKYEGKNQTILELRGVEKPV